MMLKQVARRLLENDESQCEDEADVQTRSQHTGVLKSRKVNSFIVLYTFFDIKIMQNLQLTATVEPFLPTPPFKMT